MSLKEDQKSKTNWFKIAATGAVALGSAYALVKLNSEKNQLCKELENNTKQCNNDFIEAKYLSPQVGDLVEIRRDLYSHWCVYVGNGMVVHLVDYISGKAQVLCQPLEEVANNHLCRVNNLEMAADKRHATAFGANHIKERAFQKLNQIVDYDVLHNNCEHFATLCRYGIRFSEQSLATTNTPIIRSVAPLLAKSTPGSALTIARAANYSSY